MTENPGALLLYVGVESDIIVELVDRNGAPIDVTGFLSFRIQVRAGTDSAPVVDFETNDVARIHQGTHKDTDPTTLRGTVSQDQADELVPGLYIGQVRIGMANANPPTKMFNVVVRKPVAQIFGEA